MGIATQQEIPVKKVEGEQWTFKKLFSSNKTVETLASVFVNPFEVLLVYLVIIIGMVELLGRHVSWPMWAFTILIISAAVFERRNRVLTQDKPQRKKK